MPKSPQRESDEEKEPEEPPVEPSGKALTEKRKQQIAGRKAAEKMWQEILTHLQRAQNGPN